jgi:hypothetical protein
MAVVCLLFVHAMPVAAQRVTSRFEPTPAVAPAEPSRSQPATAAGAGSGVGSLLSGAAIGALSGIVAAIPITAYEVRTCADCMFVGMAVPVFAAGGAIVGAVAGAAAHDSYGSRRAWDDARQDNERSRAADVGIGALLGTGAGLVATIAVTSALASRWETDRNGEHGDEALLVGIIAPVSTIFGAAYGAWVDKRGGDLFARDRD